MNLYDIVQNANNLTEEHISTDKAIMFANDAIARINVKCNANFPFFSLSQQNEEYAGFTETWQRALIIPFIVGRTKQQDSSQFEYSDAYGEFTDNLLDFKNKYTIPDIYKSSSVSSSIEPDYTGNYYIGW